MLEKTLESPLHCKEIKLVNTKGNHPWTFTGRTDAEAEAPIIWLPDVRSQLTGKDPDSGKEWSQEKRVTDDEMIGYHHWLNGHEFEQTPGESEGQGSLACYSPWDHRESDTTERLNNNNNNYNSNSKFMLMGEVVNQLIKWTLYGELNIPGIHCNMIIN